MNEDTKTVLNEFLSSLLEGIREAGAFVSEQLPLVLQEYIAWGIVKGVIVAIFCFAAFLAWVKWMYGPLNKRRKQLAKAGNIDAMDYSAGIAVTGAAAIGAVITGVQNGLLPAAQAAIAPRIYLIEQLSSLIK